MSTPTPAGLQYAEPTTKDIDNLRIGDLRGDVAVAQIKWGRKYVTLFGPEGTVLDKQEFGTPVAVTPAIYPGEQNA